MRRPFKTSVYSYTDYRKFLSDYFNEQKQKNPSFSYRKFAEKAGYNSSGLLIDIIQGRTNVQTKVITKLVQGIGLISREAAYFESLVHFNQAETDAERNTHYNRMVASLAGPTKAVKGGQFKYYSQWHYIAIRELLSIHDFRGDYAALARELEPAVTPLKAKHAMNFLVKHGFVVKDADGRYRAAQQSITSGKEVHNLNVANFQRTMMDMGKQAIDRFPADERNISTLSFSASPQAAEEIRKAIDLFRTQIRGIYENCTGEDRIYQFNFQFFPLSRKKKVDP